MTGTLDGVGEHLKEGLVVLAGRDRGSAGSEVVRPAGRVRSTRQADSVEAVLGEADGFRTAQDLFAELRGRGDRIGLTTVYRHLNSLAGSGRVDVLHSFDGEARYRLCGGGAVSASDDHHHHVVCRVCGRSVEVRGAEVEAWARRVAEAAGYTQVSHRVEVFGLCPEHSAPVRARRARRA